MKVLYKTEIGVASLEDYRQGTKHKAYGAHVTIETDDAGLHDAILDAILRVEESLR